MQGSAWLWHDKHARREWNKWVAFRKEFHLDALPKEAVLSATADAQYVAFLNGVWVGQGPIRSFPHDWRYDTFSVANLLREGPNCLSLLGHSIGVSTFRYILSNSSVRALLTADGDQVVATDSTWKCQPDIFGPQKEFRMACQLGWLEPPLTGGMKWQLPGFDDSGWHQAAEVCDSRELRPAEVQVIPVAEVLPIRVIEQSFVTPPATIWAIALRSLLLPGQTAAQPDLVSGLVGVVFHVEHPCDLLFEFQKAWSWVQAVGTLNGQRLERASSCHNPFESGLALKGRAVRGRNSLVLDVTGYTHDWTMVVSVDEVALVPEGGFVVVGPLKPGEAPELLNTDAAALAQHPNATLLEPSSDPRAALTHPFTRTAHARRVEEILPPAPPGEINLVGKNDLEGQAILDLGRMTVGYWTFDVEATGADPSLTLNGFESIQEGRPDLCWEMSNTMEVRPSNGVEKIRSLQRRGARYVLLQGRDVRVRNFKVVEATAPLGEGASFECSDPLLNSIFEMCKLTARLCSEDTFVDCPTYEQTFWVGDARNEALIHRALFGDARLPERCWKLAAQSLAMGPMVNSHLPSGWDCIIPAWSFLWSIGCWEHFVYTADRGFLTEIYPAMLTQMKSAAQHLNEEALFEMQAWNFIDWAPMDQPREGVCTANQGWFILAAEATKRAALELGDSESADFLCRIIKQVKDACNRVLYNNRQKAYTDCIKSEDRRQSSTFSVQTQCILGLAGVPRRNRKSRITSLILGNGNENGFVQPGTPFFLFFILEYLEKEGAHREALDIIRANWGLMLERGATTCWELLPGYMPGDRWTRSHCHAWSAGPAYFLQRNQLGCVPFGTDSTQMKRVPAWRRFVFHPKPVSLEWCRGEIPTPGGVVRVEWRYHEEGGIEYEISVPDGIEVRVARDFQGRGRVLRV